MINIVVVSITYRTLNNLAAALQVLISKGAKCSVVWIPTTQRIPGQTPSAFGFNTLIDATNTDAKDVGALTRLREQVRAALITEKPDVVISDDMTNWPNRIVYEVVKSLPDRPWQVAWQHGLYQPWYEMRQRFDADYFFCYGRMHTLLLGTSVCPRVLPVGLPKLDALQRVESRSAGYLSWFAQPAPAHQHQLRLLADIAAETGMPVRVRPHPAMPDAFNSSGDRLDELGLLLDDPSDDPIDALAGCNSFLSTHSSAVLEALMLGKPAILFPAFGLTSFIGYPNVAGDFTARAYSAAAKRYKGRQQATAAFLEDAIGGRRFDHAERSAAAIEALASMRSSGMTPENSHWWRTDTELRSQMQMVHPLTFTSNA